MKSKSRFTLFRITFTKPVFLKPVFSRLASSKPTVSTLTLPLCLALSSQAIAIGKDKLPEESGLTVGLLSLYSHSIFHEGKSQQNVMPFIEAYYGPLFISGVRVGSFIAGDNDWNINISYGLEEVADSNRDDSPLLKDMKQLDRVYDLALSGEMETTWGNVSLSIANDVSNRHKGNSASLNYSYPLSYNKHRLYPSLYLSWLSKHVTNYYYGVKPNQQSATRPAYIAGDSFISTIGLDYEYSMIKNHSFLLSLSLSHYSNEITDSPIVTEKHSFSTGFGYFYSF